jgi:adenosylmethionine-8-amino-7-oxononanoate aminotransferase
MSDGTSSFWHPFADMAEVGGHEFTISRGEGVHVFDAAGRGYIDAAAGLWYCHVGHGRPEIAQAVAAQMHRLEAYSTFGDLVNEPVSALTDRLAALTEMPDARVFLTLGGGDGIEAAAKLARMYWSLRDRPHKTHLISRAFGYHGTHGFGTSLAGIPTIRDGFGPLTGDVSQVAYDSLDALEQEIERLGADNVAAFFCEPVIGAGGVRPAPAGYLETLSELCHRHDVLLIVDGVICAFGRVGTWFGYERWGMSPDMVVLAKGLTSGYLPLGAVLVSGEVADPFWSTPGRVMVRHGATYAGHPTCCAAAMANLDLLESEQLIPRGRELEGALWEAVAPLADHPACGDVRGGVGLMAAVDLNPPLAQHVPDAAHHFYDAIREAGVIVRGQATGVAIGPPLTIAPAQLTEIGEAVSAGLDAVAELAAAGSPA